MTSQFLHATLLRLLKSIYVLPHEHPLIPGFFSISSSLLSVIPKYAKKDYLRVGNPKPVFFYLIFSSLRFSFEPKIIILQKTVQKSLWFRSTLHISASSHSPVKLSHIFVSWLSCVSLRNPFLDFVVLFEGAGGGGQYAPSPFLQQVSGEIFKEKRERFFLHLGYLLHVYHQANLFRIPMRHTEAYAIHIFNWMPHLITNYFK